MCMSTSFCMLSLLGAEVGLTETVIQVSETNRSVELCAVIRNANLEREVTVTLSTQGGSATGTAKCLLQ